MAWDSRGYDGTVNEPTWATLHRLAGTRYGVESGWTVSGVPGARLLRITAGRGWGWGVTDTVDADETITCAANATGAVRWDTVVVRRNWSTNTSSYAVLTGGASKAVASSIATNGGVLAEQPIALAPVPPGATSLDGIGVVSLAGLHPQAIVSDSDVDPYAPPIGMVRYTTTGRQYIWDGARWLPMAGDTPYARGEVFPPADFNHDVANYIYRVPLTQSTGHAFGGARVESGRLVVPTDGIYRVRAKQRFVGRTDAIAGCVLIIRAGAGGSSSGGTLIDAAWGSTGPGNPNLTLRCDETVRLNAGGYVEVFRSASLANVTSLQAPAECTASISLERK